MKGSSSQFFYDGNHQRWKHVAVLQGSATETTTYIGKFFEKVLLPTGITAYRHYIPAGTSMVLYERSTSAVATYYLTNDHLGSPNFVTTATGSVLIAENFAALGYRRGSNWTGSPTDTDYTNIVNTTQRGFTGHEMMDNLDLINMDGRINSALGQFISPDPTVQNPGNTQSFNRYAYVLNNPLTLIDPTGFAQECFTVNVPDPGSIFQNDDGSWEIDIGGGTNFQSCFDIPDPTPAPTPGFVPGHFPTPDHGPEHRPPAPGHQPQGNQNQNQQRTPCPTHSTSLSDYFSSAN